MDILSYNSSLSYDPSSVDVLCSRKDCYGSLDIKCGSPPPLLHADEVKGQTKKRSRHHSASHRNLKKRRFIGVPDDNKDSNHHSIIIPPPPPPIAFRQLSTVAPLTALTALTDDEPAVQGLSPAQNAMQAEIIEPPSSSSSSASSPLTSFSLSGSNFLNDRYAFVNDIIQSQFGRVFIATDRFKMKSFNLNSNQVFDPDNVYVAIKQSSKERMSSFGLRTADDVRREASVLRILNGSSSFASHPYRQFIYQYIDEFETDAYHHIVTSYASKGDLLSLAVPANGHGAMNTFPETFARNVFSQVIAGVALLHNIGVGHCDLSLENFCLRSDGSISIIDLGAAQIHPNSILWREAESDSSLHPDVKYLQTIPNHTVPLRSSQPFESFLVTPVPNAAIPGKKNYICSECFEGADYDIFAADCWAIGVSLFAAVTGKFPYARPMEDDVHFRALMSGAWAAEERKRSDDAKSGAAADQSRPTLSYELIQLLDAIFKPSALRPTVRQLLEFGWFHEQS